MSERRSRRERGRQRMLEVAQMPAAPPADDAFLAASYDEIFGGLWERPGMSDRERRLMCLAILGTRGFEMEAGVHVRAALASGDLSPDDVIEVTLQVAHYGGWPAGSVLYRALRSACEELGLEPPTLAPGDRA